MFLTFYGVEKSQCDRSKVYTLSSLGNMCMTNVAKIALPCLFEKIAAIVTDQVIKLSKFLKKENFEKSVTCRFFLKLNSPVDNNS